MNLKLLVRPIACYFIKFNICLKKTVNNIDYNLLGIRMLDQPYMTDLIEANSMGHEPNLIDIYSASWGPTDDGKTVDGPRNATMRAIVRGVNEVNSFVYFNTCVSILINFAKQRKSLKFFIENV